MKHTSPNIDALSNAWPNPWPDVFAFFAANGLPCPRGDWRLTEYELGEINGLPKSRGRVVATNGIMCYIQTAPDCLYFGHFTAWKPDVSDSPIRVKNPTPITKSAKKLDVCFVDY